MFIRKLHLEIHNENEFQNQKNVLTYQNGTLIANATETIYLTLKNNKMKKLLKLTMVLFMMTAVFTACSKDDDPANNDLFVGTYKGNISYVKDGGDKKSIENGKVTVIKTGNNYNFQFSDGIADLNGVEFEKDANTAVSVGSTESKYIRINASTLKIAFAKDGAIWTADCTR